MGIQYKGTRGTSVVSRNLYNLGLVSIQVIVMLRLLYEKDYI